MERGERIFVHFQHNKSHAQNFLHSILCLKFIQEKGRKKLFFGSDRDRIQVTLDSVENVAQSSFTNRNSIELISMKSCPPTCTYPQTLTHTSLPHCWCQSSNEKSERYRARCGGDKKEIKQILYIWQTSPWLVYQSQSSIYQRTLSTHIHTYTHTVSLWSILWTILELRSSIFMNEAEKPQSRAWLNEASNIPFVCVCVCARLVILHQLISVTIAINNNNHRRSLLRNDSRNPAALNWNFSIACGHKKNWNISVVISAIFALAMTQYAYESTRLFSF